MGTEFYETMFIIKGARAETEDDLNQLFEDFGINGGQLAASFSPPFMMDANLTHDAEPAATLPESGRRCKRGPRKRRIPLCTDQGWFLGDHFGGTSCLRDAPSACEGRNRGLRTNGPHWTTEEVTTLVDGLEEFGGRRWSAIKKKYFPTLDRTTTNLKDKWRNLRKSYTGNAERRCYLVLPDHLIQRIKRLAATGN